MIYPLHCQNKKSYKKVTFLVAQKKYGTSSPVQGMKRIYFLSEKNKVTILPIKNKTNSALFNKKVARMITLSSSTPIVKCQHDFNIPVSTLQDRFA